MRRARGNYYASALETRPHPTRDSATYARQVARQARTFADARARLDATGQRGYVELWSDRTQSRTRVAERDTDGSWWSLNPYNGERVPLA